MTTKITKWVPMLGDKLELISILERQLELANQPKEDPWEQLDRLGPTGMGTFQPPQQRQRQPQPTALPKPAPSTSLGTMEKPGQFPQIGQFPGQDEPPASSAKTTTLFPGALSAGGAIDDLHKSLLDKMRTPKGLTNEEYNELISITIPMRPPGMIDKEWETHKRVIAHDKIAEELSWDETLVSYMEEDAELGDIRYRVHKLGEGQPFFEGVAAKTRGFLTTPIGGFMPLSITDIAGLGLITTGAVAGGKGVFDKLFASAYRQRIGGSWNATRTQPISNEGLNAATRIVQDSMATSQKFKTILDGFLGKYRFRAPKSAGALPPSKTRPVHTPRPGPRGELPPPSSAVKDIREINMMATYLADTIVKRLPRLTATNTGIPAQQSSLATIISGLSNEISPTLKAIQSGKMDIEGQEIYDLAPETAAEYAAKLAPPEVPAPKPTVGPSTKGVTLFNQPVPDNLVPKLAFPMTNLTGPEINQLGVRNIASKLKDIAENTKLPAEYRTRIKDLVEAIDKDFHTQKTIDRRKELLDYVKREEAAGRPVGVPEEYIKIAGQLYIKDLTPRQLEEIYNEATTLVKQGRLKNKLLSNQAYRDYKQAVGALVEQGGGVPPETLDPITAEVTRNSFIENMKDKVDWYLQRTYLIESLMRDLDKYKEGGPFTKLIWDPFDLAKDAYLREITKLGDDFIELVTTQNVNVHRMMTQKHKFGNVTLTGEERIGVYMNSLNNDNLMHLKYGNRFDDALIRQVINSMTKEERVLADFMHGVMNDPAASAELGRLRPLIEGKPYTQVDEYWPISVNWKGTVEQPQRGENLMMREQIARAVAAHASSHVPKGAMQERTHKAMQPLNLNAFDVFVNNRTSMAFYKAFGLPAKDVDKIINNDKFRAMYEKRVNKQGYQVLKKWVQQVSDPDPMRAITSMEHVMKFLRVNAVSSALGLNLTVAMKQFPSFSNAMAEIGVIPAVNGMLQHVTDYRGSAALIKELSPQVYARTFERELAELKAGSKSIDQLMRKKSIREWGMIFTTTVDKFVVGSVWRGAYEMHLRRYPAEGREASAKYAERVLKRTQPFFDIKDVIEFQRSGELGKLFTTFTNQLSKNWNYYRFHIYGQSKAGEINAWESLRKVLFAFILPAFAIAAITRSDITKEPKDAVVDMAAMGAAAMPLFGPFISAALRGMIQSGPIALEPFEQGQSFFYNISKGEAGKAGLDALELLALLRGIPYNQPKRTIQGTYDLIMGNSQDWARLIWSEYVREQTYEEGQEVPTYVPPAHKR